MEQMMDRGMIIEIDHMPRRSYKPAFIQTGHFSNYTPDCDPDVPTVFDRNPASFPGLNAPRADYFEPPPNDFSGFINDPLGTLLPLAGSAAQADEALGKTIDDE